MAIEQPLGIAPLPLVQSQHKGFQQNKGGLLKGRKLDRKEFERSLDLYYDMHGWDRNGIPTSGKLVELGLGWVNGINCH